MTDEELAKNEFDKDEIKRKIVPILSESTAGGQTSAPILRQFPGANSISFEERNM